MEASIPRGPPLRQVKRMSYVKKITKNIAFFLGHSLSIQLAFLELHVDALGF